MGPRPILPVPFERDLVTWILAMERDGHPVSRHHIIDKANRILAIYRGEATITALTGGWYQRFIARHEDDIKSAKAFSLTKSRNGIDADIVADFFHELVHALSLVDMDPRRVFNMDETSFTPAKTAKKVVVHRSTKQVYVEESSASSHVTVVACVSASGIKIPPLFILPGDRVTTEVCDSLVIPGACVTTSEKGWTNSFVCRKWLRMLSDSIPSSTPRPILLVLDGCSSHYSNYIFDEASALGILLQFLPSNSTHLFQPLDVSVFRPFKRAIRVEIAQSAWDPSATTITKQQAIAIACGVWASSTKETSIVNGFACTGLCPPSIGKMMARLALFKPTQASSIVLNDDWLERSAIVRKELLLLPPAKKKRGPRKTLTVSGKFITADYHAMLQAQSASRPKRSKSTQGRAGQIVASDVVESCIV